MLAVLLLLFPSLAAIFILACPGKVAKWAAFIASLLELGLFFVALYAPEVDPELLSYKSAWIPSLGISFSISFTGISSILVGLTSILVSLIILSSFSNRPYSDKPSFYILVLLMQTALVGVFMSLDCFLFYVFWEAALIPVYFIATLWGDENRVKATLKFFLYTVFGSLFMLGGIIYLYLKTPLPHSFDIISFSSIQLSYVEEQWIFLAFFIAFAVKIPIFPFHSWQPDTYTRACTPATMLLSGIMLKMGLFGIIRWIIPIAPAAFLDYRLIIVTMCVIGIIYASVIAIQQKDFKRLVAFSSIAHVGLIAAGLFTGNLEGIQGSIIQMFNHGINVVGMFFILEIIAQRTSTRQIVDLGGIINSAPKLGICFLIILLGNVGLPLTNGFAGEFLLLMSVYQFNMILGGIAGLTIILGAVYLLRMYKNIMLGDPNAITQGFKDLSFAEMSVLVPICILILVVGVYPNLILKISEPMAMDLVQYLSETTLQAFNLKH